jgi:outer membrane immunogenic protein
MKNKGFLLATAATGAAAFAPGAMAADMPVKAAPVVVPPAASWAGFYIGVHAGAAWHQAHVNTLDNYGAGPTTTGTGFIGGGQIGYNWQSGNFVFGLEADGSWLNAKAGQGTVPGFYGSSHKVEWLATGRARFGLAVGNTMAYTTGGVAFGEVKNKFSLDPSPFGGTKSESKTRIGWAVGGGVEHMWSRNVTIALEGLFVDLGRSTVNTTNGKSSKFSNQLVIGRAKLNYKW